MKKNKNLKKVGVLLLAVMSMFALTACGSSNTTTEAAVSTASKEDVFSGEELSLDINTDNIVNTFNTDSRIYFYTVEYSTDGTTTTNTITSFDFTGSDKQSFPITIATNGYANSFAADSQGNIYAVMDEPFEDNSDPNNYIYKDNYYLIKWDGTGQEVWRIDMAAAAAGTTTAVTDSTTADTTTTDATTTDATAAAGEMKIAATSEAGETTDTFYAGTMVIAQDKIAVMTGNGIMVFDTESNLINTIGDSTSSFTNMYTLKDNSVLVGKYTETSQEYYQLDLTTGTISDTPIVIPGNSNNYTFYKGYTYDLSLVDSTGLYGFNIGDAELTKIMDYIDSDIDTSYLNGAIFLSDTEFISSYYDSVTSKNIYMKFTKVQPKDVVDKTVITLACYYLDSTIRSHIVAFNKASDTYKISIDDYSKYDTADDYTAGTTKLNTDIISGKVPDIMILNNQLPTKTYMEKGLFEDLNPYIDNDSELDRANYLTNIFDAYSVDGKMYQLVPSFTAFTVIGKTADVGSQPGWTIADLNKVLATKPSDIAVFPEVDRATILNYCMQMSGDQFVNWQTGECSFNTAGFTDLLAFLKQFPETFDYSVYDDSKYMNDYSTMYRDGKALLSTLYLGDFSTYAYQKKGTFGEDITFIGFPSSNKNGSAINCDYSFAMSSKSKNKDGVWEFLRYYLTDEYQDSITYNFPVSIKRLEELAKESQQKPYYLDENGNKVEYDNTFYMNDVEVVIDPCTDDEVNQVMTFLKSLNQTMSTDTSLINIITEEAASYFSGQKTAQEVADIIQSRAQIYVSENM